MDSFFKRPLFWVCFSLVSLLATFYASYFFNHALPIVNISITMDRDQALAQARDLAAAHQWGPEHPQAALSFDSDTAAQTFIELAGGGPETFVTMLREHWYEAYQWHVRLFKEFETNETHIYFTPQGEPYGFQEKIDETTEISSLKRAEALELAKQELSHTWQTPLENYELVEASKKVLPNNRIDRTFVFERTDRRLNEGTYRLKVVVSGNKVTQVHKFVKIPESFNHTYQQMRSYNEAIASAGSISAYILYLIIGCILGLFYLLRINWIVWRMPLIWASIVALAQLLLTFNNIPLLFMHYSTENSILSFLMQIIIQAAQGFFFNFIILALVFTAAESLTRKAFGHHVQLWRSWAPGVANSYTILGQTIGAYLQVGLDLAYMVAFYVITTRYFGWWTPLSQMTNPNALATYLPWLPSLAMSLEAGFLEECKFRAIPLAGAALLGERFGKKRWWIAAAFIVQALIFSAAHANYPTQPAYARLIELIIPSFIFAGIYLRFGLLPSVISHYIYDVILIALPVFSAQAPFAWINKGFVLLGIAVPLLIVAYRTYKHGITELVPQALNSFWKPTEASSLLHQELKPIALQLNKRQQYIYGALALLGLIAWSATTRFTTDAPPVKISREQAIAYARKTLEQQAVPLSDAHKPYATLTDFNTGYYKKLNLPHRYIWQTYGPETYHALLGSHLLPPHWFVRFLRFDGTLQERAESFLVDVGALSYGPNPEYGTLEWKHQISEQTAGTTLASKEARNMAQEFLAAQGYNLDAISKVKEKPIQHPNRKDWIFTFAHKDRELLGAKPSELSLQTSIAGDTVYQYNRSVKVPQQFKRADLNRQNIINSVTMLCQLFVWMLFIIGMLCGLIFWAKGLLPHSVLLTSFIGYIFLFAISAFNSWPQIIAQFNTQAPFINQAFTTYGYLLVRYLLRTIILALTLSFVISYRPRYGYKHMWQTVLIGISSGLILRGTWALFTLFKPIMQPIWGFYAPLANMYPGLAYVDTFVISFLMYASAFTLCALGLDMLTDYGTKRLIPAALACIAISLCSLGMLTLDSVGFWLISGILFGIIVFGIWHYMLRFSPASIPVLNATSCILTIIRYMLFDLIPYGWMYGILSIIVIALITIWYVYYAHKKHA